MISGNIINNYHLIVVKKELFHFYHNILWQQCNVNRGSALGYLHALHTTLRNILFKQAHTAVNNLFGNIHGYQALLNIGI